MIGWATVIVVLLIVSALPYFLGLLGDAAGAWPRDLAPVTGASLRRALTLRRCGMTKRTLRVSRAPDAAQRSCGALLIRGPCCARVGPGSVEQRDRTMLRIAGERCTASGTRYGVAIPIFFSAASIRCGGSIFITSASPVSSRLFRLERIAASPDGRPRGCRRRSAGRAPGSA